MLRPILILFVGTLFGLQAVANDPFDKNQRQSFNHKEATSIKSTKENQTAPCHNTANGILPTIPFNQINVVGVLQYKNDWQLMLLADNQISLAKQGDFVATEHVQIEKIDKRNIHFLRWDDDKNCAQPTSFNLQF